MTAVVTLRKAAEKLRGLAEAATPGPWRDEYSAYTGPVVLDPESRSALDNVAACQHYRASVDVQYIAAMHPGVGLALADWLEQHTEEHSPSAGRHECDWVVDYCSGVAVARAVLGETS